MYTSLLQGLFCLRDLQVLFSVTFLKKEGTKYLKITCVEVSSSLLSHGGRDISNFKLASETNPLGIMLKANGLVK